MNPNFLLSIAAGLAGFVLKTTLAFGICVVFSRLVDSPNSRFLIWLGFLCGAGAYWLWLANGFFAGGAVAQLSASSAHSPIHSVAPLIGAWLIPGSWAFPLGITLRAMGIVYLLVLSCILLAHIKKQRQLKWVLSFSSEPPVELAKAFQPLAESLHVSRSRLLVLSGVTSPATFGWIRPTILLPDICLEQDLSELEDILLHELHHVRRWDFVWNGFAVLCRALLFFHPAAWYALRKMQFDRELACDLAVTSHSPGRRAKYAECLTRFARLNLAQDSKTWDIDFAASSEHLKARVRSILAESKKASGWLVCLRTACGLALIAGFLGIAPSLAVPLFYTHRQISHPQISQPLTSAIRGSTSGLENRRRAIRKLRFSPPAAPAATDPAFAKLGRADASQLSQPTPEPAAHERETSSTPKLVPGLIRRYLPPGAPGAGGDTPVKQRSVALIDQESVSQGGKKDARATSKTLQESALLLGGMYKRLGNLKPDR